MTDRTAFVAIALETPARARTITHAAGLIGLCVALAGCSAHERQTSAAPQPSAPPPAVAVSQVSDVPVGVAPVAPQSGAIKAVVVTAKAQPAGPTAKLGKSGGGLASWYGDRFHGRKTASGERFDMASLSAAHPSFPLPSYVRVTNVSNGRSLVVRVNDRGPFHGGRVIDVSSRAADILGFRSHGVGTVKLDYVGKAPSSSDDRRLLASYQEFGRPSLPPGVQMAGLAPVSDLELAADNGSGGAYAVASRTVVASADYVMASAASAASTAKSAAEKTASTARTVVRKILPEHKASPEAAPPAEGSGMALASAEAVAAPTAYAPPQPVVAALPAAIAAPRAKRVVAPAEPALASVAPSVRSAGAPMDVSSRIAASFQDFAPSSVAVETGASVRAEGVR